MIETVGVLGGTFDPVHLGHLHVAACVRRAFALRRVLLVPSATPPHKNRHGISPAATRVAMLRLAVAGEDGLDVSTLETDRGGVSYTIDTLRTLRSGPPRLAPVFIVGTDALAEIRTWKDHDDLLAEFDLIAVDRPGSPLAAVRASLGTAGASRIVRVPFEADGAGPIAPAPGSGGRVFHLAIPPASVSSSAVRTAVARGEPLDRLVPPSVAVYIHGHGLYRPEDIR